VNIHQYYDITIGVNSW